MDHAEYVVTQNVTSVYAEPDPLAERISQARHGDILLVSEFKDDFAYAEMPDGYQGWVLERHLRRLNENDDYRGGTYAPESARHELGGVIRQVRSTFAKVLAGPNSGDIITVLPLGSQIFVLNSTAGHRLQIYPGAEASGDFIGVRLADGRSGFIRSFPWCDPTVPDPTLDQALHLLCDCIGTPYLWGGITPYGFDCSGLTQLLYRLIGRNIPRDAYQQAACKFGRRIDSEAVEGNSFHDVAPHDVSLHHIPTHQKPTHHIPMAAGDLVFFLGPTDERNRGITHVGIAISRSEYLHATHPDGVIVTRFDDPYYSRRYRTVCRWRL